MIKKVSILFLISGFTYGVSVWSLRFLAGVGQVDQMAGIAEFESLLQLLAGVIGFGLQTEAIRNISFSENWREVLAQSQKARFTLSLFCLFFCLLGVYDENYFYFFLAPWLALSIDYALYARGLPVMGSLISLSRVIVPLLAAVLSALWFPSGILVSYLLGSIITYLISNYVMAVILQVPLFYSPSLNAVKLYLNSLPLGVINLCFYFFGLGIILYAQLFFPEPALVIAFLGVKFYLIFKGAFRMLHQAFISQMKIESVCLDIDRISIMISLFFLGSVVIFPGTFIRMFFGDQYLPQTLFFVFLGLSTVVFSIFSSATTRVLLERKEAKFIKIAVSVVAFTMIFMLGVQTLSRRVELIGMSLLVGEAVFSMALIHFFFTWEQVKIRLLFLLKCCLGFFIPVGAKYMLDDVLIAYLGSFSLLGLVYFGLTFSSFDAVKARGVVGENQNTNGKN